MKISVDEFPQSPREIDFFESVEELNRIYSRESNREFGFPPALAVHLVYYRSGAELFFNGYLSGSCTGRCARCVEQFEFALDKEFELILSPVKKYSPHGAEELRGDDLGLSYYAADEIDLAPLIAEQVLLALPTRPLCKEDCRGLCGRCGANLNQETCHCAAAAGDPRMALFRTLKVGR